MTGAKGAPAAKSGILPWAGWILSVGLLAYAVLLHAGIGPIPSSMESSWYSPRPFLLNALQGSSLGAAVRSAPSAIALLVAPALAVAVAVFLTSRSALARLLSTTSVISAAFFVYYGVQAPGVWAFFHWRWSGCMVLFSLCLASALNTPLLAASWRRRSWPMRLLLYLPIFVAVVVFERNVTGTDDALMFAISPWPLVQVFGLEVFASAIALLMFGCAIGLWLLSLGRGRSAADAVALWIAAAIVVAAVPTSALWLGSRQGLLPFHADGALLAVTAGLALVTWLIAAGLGARSNFRKRSERARLWALGGLLLGAPLLLGQILTRLDYTATRDTLAQRVIDGLQHHYARESIYPESLEELVKSGDLSEVPRPRIGFTWPPGLGSGLLPAQEFVYQSFGTSYVLEFSAPRWIQCAYNPPYEDDEEEELEDHGGAWSCPSKPPELW